HINFFGSLNESTGFTLFLYDRPNGILTVRKDMDGLQLSHSFPALDFWIGEGNEPDVFDRYFQVAGTPKPAVLPAIGWTSWYNHFTRISEATLMQNLDSFAAFCQNENQPAFFQIDDGWQTAVGDWLSVKPDFPQGMGAMAQTIKARGLSPGLWLAPFVAVKDSELVRKHPDWLLKDKKGKPLRVGWNPMWKGWYYTLDFYNNEVRNHLGGVFHTVLDRWSFDLVKLDFLFAVCLVPPPGKTRGQVMHEAMEFLRKLAGPKKILACGVPLGAAFGFADYCRIGGDIHLAWEHRLLSWLRFRERASALASLRSTLGRRQLNGRAFLNDPDVFILRNENQKLTLVQQQTVLTINALLGSLLFTSDDPGKYSPEQTAELEAALELRGSRIVAVTEIEKDCYAIEFDSKDERYLALCNLSNRAFELPATATGLKLQPFESIILKR
ncbi:MAG TPA: alpha-galactosidase, partial [Saprospiraceae bacterium]|nr:alpha-galactosidase [Saprospiraceae bacterium]